MNLRLKHPRVKKRRKIAKTRIKRKRRAQQLAQYRKMPKLKMI